MQVREREPAPCSLCHCHAHTLADYLQQLVRHTNTDSGVVHFCLIAVEARRNERPPVCDGGDRSHGLDWRYLKSVLSDGCVVGVADIPCFTVKTLRFPRGSGNESLLFFFNINAGRRSKAEQFEIAVNAFNTETCLVVKSSSHNVKIHIR